MYRLIAAAMLCVLMLVVPDAGAAPITSFGGTSAFITTGTGQPAPFNSPSISLNSLSITSIGFPTVNLVPGQSPTDGNLTLNTTPTPNTVVASQNSFTFTVPNSGLATPFGTETGGFLTFVMAPTLIPINGIGANTSYSFGSLTDNSSLFTLTGNTSGLDFGPIGSQFRFQSSVQGITYSGGANGTFTSVGNPTGSFTALAVDPVPEPATLALWGAVSVAGAWYGRRRLLKPSPKL